MLFILSKVSSFVVLPNAGILQLGKQQKQNEVDSNAGRVVMNMAKDRRSFLVDTTAAAASSVTLLVPQFNAVAAENNNLLLNTYQDEDCGFEVSVPSNWVKSVQSLRDRRKIVFFTDPSTSSSDQEKNLIFIAYTPVRDDFTSLTSFGSVEQVAEATILPKGELAGLESDNTLITAESKKNAYYFDYTTKIPDQPKRHVRTIFSLVQGATGGAGSILVTLTAQTSESQYDQLKGTFDQIIDSFAKK